MNIDPRGLGIGHVDAAMPRPMPNIVGEDSIVDHGDTPGIRVGDGSLPIGASYTVAVPPDYPIPAAPTLLPDLPGWAWGTEE